MGKKYFLSVLSGGYNYGRGGSSSASTTSTSTQCSVMLGSASANSVIRIVQGSTEILNFTTSRAYEAMLFTSPQLALNTSYTVYINGVQSTSFTTSSVFTNAGGGNSQNPGGRADKKFTGRKNGIQIFKGLCIPLG